MVPFKPSIHRIFFIDHKIRENSFPTTVSLARDYRDRYGTKVNSRTIANDIAALKLTFHAPLAYSYQERGYYYKDPNFHLPELRDDIQNIFPVMERALRTRTADIPAWQQSFLSSLVDKVLPLSKDKSGAPAKASVLLDGPEPSNAQVQGVKAPILQSLENNAALALRYVWNGKKPVTLRFRPIHFICAPGVSLLFGRDETQSEPRYALLRFEHIKEAACLPDSDASPAPGIPPYIQVQTTHSGDIEVILAREQSDLLLVFALPPLDSGKPLPEYSLLAQTELFAPPLAKNR
jgi:predicted DNA-binding transcriptional regulator YafY